MSWVNIAFPTQQIIRLLDLITLGSRPSSLSSVRQPLELVLELAL